MRVISNFVKFCESNFKFCESNFKFCESNFIRCMSLRGEYESFSGDIMCRYSASTALFPKGPMLMAVITILSTFSLCVYTILAE